MWRRFWLPIFSFDFKILTFFHCFLKYCTVRIVKNHWQTLKRYRLQLKILPNSYSEWMYIILMHTKQNIPFQTFLLWDISRKQFISGLKSSQKWNINIFIPNGAGLLRLQILTSKFLLLYGTDIQYIKYIFSLSAEYYNIMQDGCPSDQYTSLQPRLDLEDRFQTQTFKFQV